jgi:hypothetical protein
MGGNKGRRIEWIYSPYYSMAMQNLYPDHQELDLDMEPVKLLGALPLLLPYYYKGRVTGSRTGYSYRRGDARQGSGGCWQARKRCS